MYEMSRTWFWCTLKNPFCVNSYPLLEFWHNLCAECFSNKYNSKMYHVWKIFQVIRMFLWKNSLRHSWYSMHSFKVIWFHFMLHQNFTVNSSPPAPPVVLFRQSCQIGNFNPTFWRYSKYFPQWRYPTKTFFSNCFETTPLTKCYHLLNSAKKWH